MNDLAEYFKNRCVRTYGAFEGVSTAGNADEIIAASAFASFEDHGLTSPTDTPVAYKPQWAIDEVNEAAQATLRLKSNLKPPLAASQVATVASLAVATERAHTAISPCFRCSEFGVCTALHVCCIRDS
eukprot:12160099-Alexandrium_andersonii.AAC.1